MLGMQFKSFSENKLKDLVMRETCGKVASGARKLGRGLLTPDSRLMTNDLSLLPFRGWG